MQQEELLIVCDMFGVYFDEASRALLESAGRAENAVFIPKALGERDSTTVEFSRELHILNFLISARLELPGTNVFKYIRSVYLAASRELNSATNIDSSLLVLAREACELATNYIGLVVNTPGMFADEQLDSPDGLFQAIGPLKGPLLQARCFLEQLVLYRDSTVTESMLDGCEDIPALWHCCRTLFARRCAMVTAFSSEVRNLLSAFLEMAKISPFKSLMITTLSSPLSEGIDYNTKHSFGFLSHFSGIPSPNDSLIEVYNEIVYKKLKACRTLGAHRKLCDNFLEQYKESRAGLLSIARELMKNNIEGVDCTAAFISFLRGAVDANVGRSSLAYAFSLEAQSRCCTDGYALMLTDLLLDLALPVVRRTELLARVDVASAAHLPSALPRARISFFGEPPTNPRPLNAAANFFFLALEALTSFFVPLLSNAEHIYRAIDRLRQEKKRHSKGSFQRTNIAAHLRRLKIQFECYRVIAGDTERVAQFAELHIALFTKTIQKPISLPENHIIDYVEFHYHLSNIIPNYFKAFRETQLSVYLDFLDELLDERYASFPLHVRSKFTELLLSFSAADNNSGIDVIVGMSAPRLVRLFRGLMAFFAAVTSGEEAARDRFTYRLLVLGALKPALDREMCVLAFVELSETKEAKDFLGHILADLNYFLETAFSNLTKLAELEQRPPSEESVGDPPEQLRAVAASYLAFGRKYLALLERLSEIAPALCLAPGWLRRLASLLNFYASKLCTASYHKMKLANSAELNIRPLSFIRDLVLIYARLGGDDAFREELLNDERCFSRAVLLDVGATAARRGLVEPTALAAFEALVLALDEMRAERENWNQIVADPPEEFLCALTYALMFDPVELPASRAVVERKAIEEHFVLNGQYDPFNRTRLEPAQLIAATALRARVDAWITERRRQFVGAQRRAESPFEVGGEGADFYGADEEQINASNDFEAFKRN